MVGFLENLEKIRTSLPRKVRQGLILSLIILGIVLLLVAGGPAMPLVAWGLIACAILFLATEPQKAIYGVILVAIFYIALAMRVFPPYDGVFVGDWVCFGGNDPWYHMRLVENLVYHYPSRIAFDPYTIYPNGLNVHFAPFFDLLLGGLIWVIGLGSPTTYTVETVGAYFPAILGALVTIPVYFIAKEIFNRKVGLLCAALIAILPGEILFRSLLGFTDHHIAEVLFSTTAVLFLILAIKRARERETSFIHIRNREWGNLGKPMIYAVLAGLALGVYLSSWIGGVLFVFIIFTYMVVQYIIDHLQGRSTDYLCIIGVPIFLIALIVVLPFLDLLLYWEFVVASLIVGVLALPVLSGVSRLMVYRGIRRAYYPVALAALGLAGVGIFYLIDPSLFHEMVGKFGIFFPSATSQTVQEARPLFTTGGPQRVWHYFTTGFFIVPIAFILTVYAAIKEQSAGKILLIIWSAITLVAMLGQIRFAYYFAVNAALLIGYFCWRIPGWISRVLDWIGFREPAPDDRGRKGAKKRKATETGGPMGFNYLRPKYVSAVLAVIIVFFLAFYPNIMEAKTLAASPADPWQSWGPNDDWHDSLIWLRDNTPDPFADPDFYYELYEKPAAGEGYDYPETAYGVMSWWDYGHWITRIAHRIPNANPHQIGIGGTGPNGSIIPGASTFFTAQNESSANWILDELGSKYVVIDVETATAKFHTMVTWAGRSVSEFYAGYYVSTTEGYELYTFYHPEYYRTMCSRLYNFGAEAVVPDNSTWVIAYTEMTDESGNIYRVVTDVANEGYPFSTYEEAQAFVDDNPEFIIVGLDPFRSPVPLEEPEHYELIYTSNTTYVKIFEYLP